MKTIIVLLSVICFYSCSAPKMLTTEPCKKNSTKRLNFYVADKPAKKDFYSKLALLRARFKALTSHNRMKVIVATSSEEMKNKIVAHLEKKQAMIGNVWFDSHGRYSNGYSSFIIGKEEFSYKTVKDTHHTRNLRALAMYCDESTQVALGSCYSGATFHKPAHKGKPSVRMNGDSLVIGIAHLLPSATVYGTEGWVMTKPGIFKKYGFALAGYPLQKRFRDEVYEPVWKNMGIWHRYSTLTQKFETVNTLSLNNVGSIHINPRMYLQTKKAQRKLAKNLARLKPGMWEG